jgi:predicted O-linked N-acetylglucosamine transferase (SPINDLY family)
VRLPKVLRRRINDKELRSVPERKMSVNPVMDYAAFARDIETPYHGIWQRWCANPSNATA